MKPRLLSQNLSNRRVIKVHVPSRPHPLPTLLTLLYQSRVAERSGWRLWICGPPTQGWVSIFIASFGGDRQHGAGDGGQNGGTGGKSYFYMVLWTPEGIAVSPFFGEIAKARFDGRNGLKRIVGRGGGERRGNQKSEGRAWNYRYILLRMLHLLVVSINKFRTSLSLLHVKRFDLDTVCK